MEANTGHKDLKFKYEIHLKKANVLFWMFFAFINMCSATIYVHLLFYFLSVVLEVRSLQSVPWMIVLGDECTVHKIINILNKCVFI